MKARTQIKCSGCGGQIPSSEPDLVLQKLGSERLRYFHLRCVGAAQKTVLADPNLWHLSHRYVDGEAN